MTFKTFSIAVLLASTSLGMFQSVNAEGNRSRTSNETKDDQDKTDKNQRSPRRHGRQNQSGNNNTPHNQNSSQQTGKQSNQSQSRTASSNNASSNVPNENTNTYAIEVVYSGTHVGQKLDGGKIVEDSTLPVAHIECGGKSFDISSTEKKLTIPAGTIPTTEGPYYKVGADGKFIRTSTPPGRETLPGKALHCGYGTIGHGGFLGELSAKVNRIEIGQTIDDNKFSYGQ